MHSFIGRLWIKEKVLLKGYFKSFQKKLDFIGWILIKYSSIVLREETGGGLHVQKNLSTKKTSTQQRAWIP